MIWYISTLFWVGRSLRTERVAKSCVCKYERVQTRVARAVPERGEARALGLGLIDDTASGSADGWDEMRWLVLV